MGYAPPYRSVTKILKSHTGCPFIGAHGGGHLAIRCEAGNHSCDRCLLAVHSKHKHAKGPKKRRRAKVWGIRMRYLHVAGERREHVKPSATCEPAWPVPIEAERVRIPR